MPTPEQILNGLALAANKYIVISVMWHILVLLFLILVFAGKRPSARIVMTGLLILLLSVGIISILISNPFNAIVFVAATALLGIMVYRGPKENIVLKWNIISISGILLTIFGLVYPHFLEDATWVDYVYKAPTGLVPCPTLLVVIGSTLLFHGFKFKRWMLYLSMIGLFYGIFGVFRLGVYLDIVLIVGAAILFGWSFTVRFHHSEIKK